MTHLASGTAIELAAEDYRATVVSVGAGLASLTRGGRALVYPHRPDQMAQGYQGKVLVPWPNRIAGGAYAFQGQTYQVPVNEPDRHAALHGLMSWVDWHVDHVDARTAVLSTFLAPQPGYPFALESHVRYALDARGLHVDIASTNVGAGPAPYGTAQHPYLTCDLAPEDGYELRLPARTAYRTDRDLTPTEPVAVEELGLDFQTPRAIGATRIDRAFTDLPEGTWQLTLRDPATRIGVSLSTDTRWVQLFTAEPFERRALAVEPMTGPANAFNSGLGLVVVQPGQTHTLSYAISGSLGA